MKGKISMQGHREHSEIADAICEQTQAIRCILDALKEEGAWWRSRRGLATQQGLREMEERIMAKLDDYLAKITTFLDKQGANIDVITTGVDGLSNDIEDIKAQLAAALAGAPEITPEHAAAFDAVVTRIDDIDARSTALAEKAAALDAMHPPPPPA